MREGCTETRILASIILYRSDIYSLHILSLQKKFVSKNPHLSNIFWRFEKFSSWMFLYWWNFKSFMVSTMMVKLFFFFFFVHHYSLYKTAFTSEKWYIRMLSLNLTFCLLQLSIDFYGFLLLPQPLLRIIVVIVS